MNPVRTRAKRTNSPNLTLSATNPETIVAAVPANADWNKKSTVGTNAPSVTISAVTVGSKNKPLKNNHPPATDPPYIIEKPINQYAVTARAKTNRFLAKILTAFLDLHIPASTIAKPAFMKITKIVATNNQRLFAK